MSTTGEYILVGQYFSYEEAESIKEQFVNQDIEFLIKDHGPNFELGAKYYQITVKSEQFEAAEKIVESQRESFSRHKTRCPKCGCQEHEEIDKGLLEKVFYAGTKLVKCPECDTRYGI